MAILARVTRLLLALIVAATPAVAAENVQLVEQKIKAGLLYNFLKYTQWPSAHGQANVVVCLFGGDPFDGHLAPMAGRTVNQATIEVRIVQPSDGVSGCSLLFVNSESKARWNTLRSGLTGKDVLTVSDFDGFTAVGGMIEFTRDDDRVGVKINVDAVAAAHLTVDDRLLKLASVVHNSAAEP